jgi:hypothetical protein
VDMAPRKTCQYEGCVKISVSPSPYCIRHGGGKRCQHDGCNKGAAQGNTERCRKHGGTPGRRCEHKGCAKAAQAGGTPHCIAHGGGKRCQQEGCPSAAVSGPSSGGSQNCWPHGGGALCDMEGCEGEDGYKVKYGHLAGRVRCHLHGGAAPQRKKCEHAAGCRKLAQCVPASVCARELSFGGSINASA